MYDEAKEQSSFIHQYGGYDRNIKSNEVVMHPFLVGKGGVQPSPPFREASFIVQWKIVLFLLDWESLSWIESDCVCWIPSGFGQVLFGAWSIAWNPLRIQSTPLWSWSTLFVDPGLHQVGDVAYASFQVTSGGWCSPCHKTGFGWWAIPT